MDNVERKKYAKLNIYVSIFGQIVTVICGLIVPKLIIQSFGSEAYGATASITQFISYIALLEGGIGGVARAALYKPLAQKDNYRVSQIVNELKHFFVFVSYVFIVYVLFLAISFKCISKVECFDWITTVILVLVISISTFAQYFIGISYAVLIQAGQRSFATQTISIIATILNTIIIVVLILGGSSLVVVKLVSGFVFAIKPIIMKLYATKVFGLQKVNERDKSLLSQKWTGLGQHIAFFLHSNTDVAILTVFSDLKYVSVYSVYNLVVIHVQNFATSFLQGLEALFGDMLAKNEVKELNRTFQSYETLISSIAILLFSVTSVMMIPFVRIYTYNISDANYIQPLFSLLLILSAFLYCWMQPYHFVVIAAGHFKQTKWSAYGEAIINLFISVALIKKFNMIGVAIGTVVATAFRLIYYVIYLSRNIMRRSIMLFFKRLLVNAFLYFGMIILGFIFINRYGINDWIIWSQLSIILTVLFSLIIVVFEMLFYKNDLRNIRTILFYKKASN